MRRTDRQAGRPDQQQGRGPGRTVIRDLLVPLVLPRLANGEQSRLTYGHHIDWDTTTATTASASRLSRRTHP
ncbi:hypothetical protein [Streptomyces sp. NBC_01244]|uniref:hypothetical protein n=1 Tax=Streptomyces sp. NBC_01244 TaxID=2903797 RepID=UPI002E102352|nr:hypothetical protein OG247_01135 [Streptomyces sp. NBC_01244]